MKVKIKKKTYIRKTKRLLETKLHCRNIIKGIKILIRPLS